MSEPGGWSHGAGNMAFASALESISSGTETAGAPNRIWLQKPPTNQPDS
jgi:hypothetical protein